MDNSFHLHIYGASEAVPLDETSGELHIWYFDLSDTYQERLRGKTVHAVTLHNISANSFNERYPEVVAAVRAASSTTPVLWTEHATREDNVMTDDQIAAAETHNPTEKATVTIEESPAPLAPLPLALPVDDEIDKMTAKQMVRHSTMMFRELTVSLANYASGHDADLRVIEARQAAIMEQLNGVENLVVRLMALSETNNERAFASMEANAVLQREIVATLTDSRERLANVSDDTIALRTTLTEHATTTLAKLTELVKRATTENAGVGRYLTMLGLGLAIGAAIAFIVSH